MLKSVSFLILLTDFNATGQSFWKQFLRRYPLRIFHGVAYSAFIYSLASSTSKSREIKWTHCTKTLYQIYICFVTKPQIQKHCTTRFVFRGLILKSILTKTGLPQSNPLHIWLKNFNCKPLTSRAVVTLSKNFSYRCFMLFFNKIKSNFQCKLDKFRTFVTAVVTTVQGGLRYLGRFFGPLTQRRPK